MVKSEKNIFFEPQKIFLISIYILLFAGLFVFFRYIHPIIPWDGDDWNTMASSIVRGGVAIPRISEPTSGQFFCSQLGTFFGYIAAFIVYPFVNDYITSIVIVNALVISVSIIILFICLYKMLMWYTNKCFLYAIIGLSAFFIFSFLIFKTTHPSTYLFWQHNLCTIYYYSVPSYLASAFSIILITNELAEKSNFYFNFNFRLALLLMVWYCINFSFVPAALIIAVTAFCLILYVLKTKREKISSMLKNCWFYVLVLLGFFWKVIVDSYRTIGTGYISVSSNIVEDLKRAFSFLLSSFKSLHPIFAILLIILFLGSIITCFNAKKRNRIDIEYIRLMSILLAALLLIGLYFVLFGTMSFSHLKMQELPVRMDTLFVFYFLIILIAVVSLVYLVERWKLIFIAVPLSMMIMVHTVLSPEFEYSDGWYTDSTPTQKYEIMSQIVSASQECDKLGKEKIIVHMPYKHYDRGMTKLLYFHNITNKVISIEFLYEGNSYTDFYIDYI